MQITLRQKTINLEGQLCVPEKKDFLKTILLIICQRACVFGCFPFGLVFFSTLCNAKTPYLSIPAIITGCLIAKAPLLKYLISALFVWAYKIAIPKNKQNQISLTVLCSSSIFVCGLYQVITSGTFIYNFSVLMGETLLCAVCCPVFFNINLLLKEHQKNEPISQENAVSLVIVMAIILWGLTGIMLPFSISVKSVISIFLVLSMSMYSNISTAATFALVFGLINSTDTTTALTLSGIYAICAVFAVLLKNFGQIGAAVGFLTGITISVLMVRDINTLSVSIADILVASVLFAALPSKIHQKTGVFLANTFKGTTTRRDFRIKEYITEELNCFSNIFLEFSRQFKSTFEKSSRSKNPATLIFDEVSSRICADCLKNCDCWQKNFNDTYKYLFSILDTTEKQGFCDVHNAPIVFTQKCVQPELFLNEFNHVYEMNKLETLTKGVKTSERRLVSNQYSQISKIIGELSDEISQNFYFDEYKEKKIISESLREGIYLKDINVIKNSDGYFEVFFMCGNDEDIEEITRIASEVTNMKLKRVFCKNQSIIKLVADDMYDVEVFVSQQKRDTEDVCGDTIIYFKTDKNKFYIILCDGMGSGEDAAKESSMTAELLAGFLKAGFSKNIALSLINSTLALKMDREGFSTIDLCEIDLRSGLVEFIKIGGAQSFIKQKERFETVSSKGLPAGILEDLNLENTQRHLEDNDMIVMVSDGIGEAGFGMKRCEWIKKLMGIDDISKEDLSQTIVNSARKKIYPRTPDDMTAAVITIHKIKEDDEKSQKSA